MVTTRRVIWQYYAFRVTTSAGFFVPVGILYLERQFGLGFIGLAYAVHSFATLLAEIPSGYLGDWLGRRASLAVGCSLFALTMGGYALADTRLAFLALHVLWATAWAFRSGTQDAWLYELLAATDEESEYSRIEGRGNAALLATSAVTAVAGGVLFTVSPTLPFVANGLLAAAGVPILFAFPVVGTEAADDEVFEVRDAVRVLRLQVGRPEIRWLVVYVALFGALFRITRIYEQPALEALGVPVAGLGVLYAGFKLASAGAASTSGWVHDRLGTRAVFALLVPAYGLLYAAIAVVPALALPVLFFNRGQRVLVRPIRNQYLNDRLADVGRATVLSGASMVVALVSGVARLAAGWGAARTGPVELLPWVGVLVAGLAGVLWLATSPVREAGTTGTGTRTGAVPSD